MSSTATADDVRRVTVTVLGDAGVAGTDVAAVATLAALVDDPRIDALGYPVIGFAPHRLAAVEGVTASARASSTVGTRSVAEAAALLGAGPGSRLIVPKRRAGVVTAAVAIGAGTTEPDPERSSDMRTTR